MPVEPWIFLSYGKPEANLADAVSALLWSQEIEIYNYRHLAVFAREFKITDVTYQMVQEIAKLWILIPTPRSLRPDDFFPGFRGAVLDELRRMREGGTPLIFLASDEIMNDYASLKPIHVINLLACESPQVAVKKLIELIPHDLIGRCKQSFDLNRMNSRPSWEALDAEMQELRKRYTDGSLRSSEELLRQRLEELTVDQYIASDIAEFKSGVHQWLVMVLLAICLQTVSAKLGEELRFAASRIPEKDPRLLVEFVSEIESKPREAIGTGGQLTRASQIIRGIARIRKQIGVLDYQGAYDIADRITLPKIRSVLLCTAYSLCRTMAAVDKCQEISAKLGPQ
jgi:hypothetical protein